MAALSCGFLPVHITRFEVGNLRLIFRKDLSKVMISPSRGWKLESRFAEPLSDRGFLNPQLYVCRTQQNLAVESWSRNSTLASLKSQKAMWSLLVTRTNRSSICSSPPLVAGVFGSSPDLGALSAGASSSGEGAPRKILENRAFIIRAGGRMGVGGMVGLV